MKVILNKTNNQRVLLFALSDEDREALDLMYHNHVIFGLYKIWLLDPKNPEKGNGDKDIAALRQKVPTLQGVGWLNLTRGFIPINETKEV